MVKSYVQTVQKKSYVQGSCIGTYYQNLMLASFSWYRIYYPNLMFLCGYNFNGYLSSGNSFVCSICNKCDSYSHFHRVSTKFHTKIHLFVANMLTYCKLVSRCRVMLLSSQLMTNNVLCEIISPNVGVL